MPLRFTCRRGHLWGGADAAPVGEAVPACPVCGGPGEVVPQLEMDERPRDRPAAPPAVPPPVTEAEFAEEPVPDGPPRFDRDPRKPGRKWGRLVGAVLALGLAGLVAYAVLGGGQRRERDRHLGRGQNFSHAKEYGRAIAEYTAAIRLDPGYAPAYVHRAAAFAERREFRPAIDDCTRAIELDPELAPAYAIRGGAHLGEGSAPLAVEDCDTALRLDPALALAYVHRAGAKLRLDKIDEAIADCNRALELSPELALPYLYRSDARARKGDDEGAEADLRKATELDAQGKP